MLTQLQLCLCRGVVFQAETQNNFLKDNLRKKVTMLGGAALLLE